MLIILLNCIIYGKKFRFEYRMNLNKAFSYYAELKKGKHITFCAKLKFFHFTCRTNHNIDFSHTELKKEKLITFYIKLKFFSSLHGMNDNVAFSHYTN